MTTFNTNNAYYKQLIGNGLTYHVPRFQRDYSWGEQQWDDLWQDIIETARDEDEPAHYMGYLVLQDKGKGTFDIIDGQQRLTTLSLIALSVLRYLKVLIRAQTDYENNQKRFDKLYETYIGYLDPVSLVTRPKLTLNRNNDTYYQNYLVGLADVLPKRGGIKSSEHTLRKAFEWFYERLQKYLDQLIHQEDKGQAAAVFLDHISDKLFFTVITVTDELNAYKVFETLNARGVRLSSTDLLKNYLFSILHREKRHEHELKTLDDSWEHIVGRLQDEKFPDFLRTHWISRRSFVRQTDLFKTITKHIITSGDVFRLVKEIEEDIEAYLALTRPESGENIGYGHKYASLLKAFSVRQPLPMLMAAHRFLSEHDYESLLKAVMVVSFRYNVIGNFQTSEQERTYHRIAERIATKNLGGLNEIIDALRGLYPSDKAFKAAFTEKSISTKNQRNRKIVKYIFCAIENRKSGIECDYGSNKLTIEHICPLRPSDDWKEFSDEQIESFGERLGNMALLPASLNRDLGNAPYSEKRKEYLACNYKLTQEVGELFTSWVPESINSRQNDLAAIATSIWRIDQLS